MQLGDLLPELSMIPMIQQQEAYIAFNLPVKEGKITVSATDPIGNRSRRPWVTTTHVSKTPGDYYQVEEAVKTITTVFTPFSMHKGVITPGRLTVNNDVKTSCDVCHIEITMSSAKLDVLKKKKENKCGHCPSGHVNFKKVIEPPKDPAVITAMCAGTLVAPRAFCIFRAGSAPGVWEQANELEESLKERLASIRMEARPYSLIASLYDGIEVPSLQDIVLLTTGISGGLAEELSELAGYPIKVPVTERKVYSKPIGKRSLLV